MEEISRDPDLSDLRKDQRYRQLVKKERTTESASSDKK